MDHIKTLVVATTECGARFPVTKTEGRLLTSALPFSSDRLHGVYPSSDECVQMRDFFIDEILGKIAEVWAMKAYDRLLRCSLPKTLDVLRGKLKGQPSDALLADLEKDLVAISL